MCANICVFDQDENNNPRGKTPTTARDKTPIRVGVLPRGFVGQYFALNALLLWHKIPEINIEVCHWNLCYKLCSNGSIRQVFIIQIRESAGSIWKCGIKDRGVRRTRAPCPSMSLPYLTHSKMQCTLCNRKKNSHDARDGYVHFSTNLTEKWFRIKRLCPLWLTFGSSRVL